jgi:hypothetical protein
VLAWRRGFKQARHPSPAYEAAFAAFREVRPDLPPREADHQVMLAVAYAAGNHTAWFWGGIYGTEKP